MGGRGDWKRGGSPELRGVGVGALVECPEAREEAGKVGESRMTIGTMLASLVC